MAAINRPQGVASLRMLASPTMIVMMSGLLITTSGHRKSFQPAVNARIDSAATAGSADRQDDLPEHAEPATAVDAGGVLELGRDVQQELAHQKHAEELDQVDDGDALVRVQQAKLAHDR